MNDSPTCGVTKTVDLLAVARQRDGLEIRLEDLENPRLEKFKQILQTVRSDGSGFFMAAISRELEKRRMNVKMIGFEPWVALDGEAERIAGLLGLQA